MTPNKRHHPFVKNHLEGYQLLRVLVPELVAELVQNGQEEDISNYWVSEGLLLKLATDELSAYHQTFEPETLEPKYTKVHQGFWKSAQAKTALQSTDERQIVMQVGDFEIFKAETQADILRQNISMYLGDDGYFKEPISVKLIPHFREYIRPALLEKYDRHIIPLVPNHQEKIDVSYETIKAAFIALMEAAQKTMTRDEIKAAMMERYNLKEDEFRALYRLEEVEPYKIAPSSRKETRTAAIEAAIQAWKESNR